MSDDEDLPRRMTQALESIARELPRLREQLEACTSSVDDAGDLARDIYRRLEVLLQKGAAGGVLGAALGKLLRGR